MFKTSTLIFWGFCFFYVTILKDMINQELLFYIKEQLSAGATKEMLRGVLIDQAGWEAQDVDEALKFVVSREPQVVEINKDDLPKVSVQENILAKTPLVQEDIKINNPSPISSAEKDSINVYAPTEVNKTPHFVGMPSTRNSFLSKIESSKNEALKNSHVEVVSKKRGLGRSLFFGLIFAVLVSGGLYVYRFYVNPTDDYILKSAYANFLQLESFTYTSDLTTEIEYSKEVEEVMQDLGIIIPPDMENSTSIPLSASFSGLFSNISGGMSSSLGFLLKTIDTKFVSVSFAGDAVLAKDTIYIKSTSSEGSEYFSDFFDIEKQTWFSFGLREKVDDKFATTIGSILHTMLSSRNLLEDFIKNDILTITSKLPEATLDDVDMVRYQFSLNMDKVLESMSPEPSATRNLLSSISVTDGEIFISRKDLFPKKVSFFVRPKNSISGAENLSLKVSTIISSVNTPAEIKPIPSAISFSERHKQLSDIWSDTQVKNTLATARAIADIYYSKKKSYLGFCKSSDDVGAASLIGPLEGVTGLGTVVCADTKKTFVLAAPLSGGRFFCVDNIASALTKEKAPTLSCVGE